MKLINTQTRPMLTIKKIILPFIFLLLATSGVFSQSVTEDNSIKIETKNNTQSIVLQDDTQIDFVIWFMGSNQSFNSDTTTPKDNTSTSRKKQFISSGTSPNKVLYRTFVKKVYSQEHAIV